MKHRQQAAKERIDASMIQEGIELVLRGMGADLSDPNFEGTPERVARMYKEMLTPENNNWATFPSEVGGMIVLRAHRVFALCPHHLQVVDLRAYVGYIPKKKVLGLSKLARAVEEHLTLPILQEDLGNAVAKTLDTELDPQGVAVVLAGEHGCMRYRGVQTTGDVVTAAMRGLFLHSIATRDEFYNIIGRP